MGFPRMMPNGWILVLHIHTYSCMYSYMDQASFHFQLYNLYGSKIGYEMHLTGTLISLQLLRFSVLHTAYIVPTPKLNNCPLNLMKIDHCRERPRWSIQRVFSHWLGESWCLKWLWMSVELKRECYPSNIMDVERERKIFMILLLL